MLPLSFVVRVVVVLTLFLHDDRRIGMEMTAESEDMGDTWSESTTWCLTRFTGVG